MAEMVMTESKKKQKSTKIHGCSKCSYQTNRAYNVQRHIAKHFEKPPKELQHMCSFSGCSFSTLRYDHLKRHIQGVHRNEDTPLAKCQQSELSTKQIATSSANKIQKTKSKLQNKDNLTKSYKTTKAYECPECEYQTNRAYNVQRHFAQHAGYPEKEMMLHVCIISGCGFSTIRWDHLNRHIKRIHPES